MTKYISKTVVYNITKSQIMSTVCASCGYNNHLSVRSYTKKKTTSLQCLIIPNLSIIQSSYSSSDFLLRFGDFDKDAASEEIPTFDRGVSTVIPHERFDYYTFEYDIALLKTDAPVEFSPTVRPVCLPEDNGQVDGEIGYITGWGTTAEGERRNGRSNTYDMCLANEIYKEHTHYVGYTIANCIANCKYSNILEKKKTFF